MAFIILAIVLSALITAPLFASKIMGLKGGLGKGALVAFVVLGSNAIIGMVASHLGPLGGILGFMGFLAAWFQVVKVVYGTDSASTFVFMFWHLFFQLLILSLLQLLIGGEAVAFAWPSAALF
ncbi:MAG: hypothetical protein GY822_18690 [Deltaproteobacteria bacterium]|nr:hypothetical protein [Deltaproteobacteria bacterium]